MKTSESDPEHPRRLQQFGQQHKPAWVEELKSTVGVYSLMLLNKKGTARPISRAGGVDREGILYVGRSGDSQSRSLYKRLLEFWNTASAKQGKAGRPVDQHVAGTHYQRSQAKTAFPLESIGVQPAPLGKAGQIPLAKIKKRERELLDDYVKKYKELPPLNHSWPKAK